ncbi:MAG: hypothetical protein KBC73_25825 [Burkholderiaceae bacterium]|nr:hypothetical protein [Burkholderiaceae bacterium]
MNRAVRVLLVWLVVIAMPVQGLAASMMMLCGPGHPRMLQGLESDAGAVQAGQVSASVHGSMHEPGHQHPCADQPDCGSGASPHHGKHGCSACAACCSMLALPAGWLLPPALAPVQAVQALAPPALPSQPPDGLDRPPRSTVA